MNKFSLMSAFALLLGSAVQSHAAAAAAAPVRPASPAPISPNPVELVAVAERVLSALDHGSGALIWDAASPVLKTIVARDQFARTAQQRVAVNGTTQGRAWRSIMRVAMTQPQGQLPSGSYLTVNFGGTSRTGKAIVETVSFLLDGDQQWRVVGVTAN